MNLRPLMIRQAVWVGLFAIACGGSTPRADEARNQSSAAPLRAAIGTDASRQEDASRFDDDAIAASVRERAAEFSRCYIGPRLDQQGVTGRVVLQATVRADGSVVNAAATENATADADLALCLIDVMESVRVPVPDGAFMAERTFSYPFVFAPRE